MYRDERNKISDEKMPITRERIFGGTGGTEPAVPDAPPPPGDHRDPIRPLQSFQPQKDRFMNCRKNTSNLWRIFQPLKSDRYHTTFTTQFTTFPPQKTIQKHPLFPKHPQKHQQNSKSPGSHHGAFFLQKNLSKTLKITPATSPS
jgi:hypothetical protein